MAAESLKTVSVVGLLNDWYVHMRDQEMEKCQEVRNQVDALIHDGKQDEKVLIYYSLLDFRHRMLFKDKDFSQALVQIEPKLEQMDDVLTFYFYFFKGMHAYDEKRFTEAIESYKKAEDKLAALPSDEQIERAEFYYKVGAAYFHLDYLSLALQQAKLAYEIFSIVPFYEKRHADSMVLLGQIYADLNEIERASHYYVEALAVYKALNQSEWIAILNQNLGWFYSKLGQHREAVRYYKLCLEHNKRQDHRLATIYLMAKSLIQIGKRQEALDYVEEAIQFAIVHENDEFLHKLKIFKAEYLTVSHLDFEHSLAIGVQYFYDKKMWDLVHEYAGKLGDYYFQRKDFQQAAIYYKMVKDTVYRNSIKGL